jgi:hypothetical protein
VSTTCCTLGAKASRRPSRPTSDMQSHSISTELARSVQIQQQLGGPPRRTTPRIAAVAALRSDQAVTRANAAVLEKSSEQMIEDDAEVVASASGNHANVGACEIVPFNEERLAADLRERVGEAIAIVQAGAMASLAIQAVGDSSGVRLVGIDANEVDCGAMQPQIQLTSPRQHLTYRALNVIGLAATGVVQESDICPLKLSEEQARAAASDQATLTGAPQAPVSTASSPAEKVRFFFDLFRSRTDVYPVTLPTH